MSDTILGDAASSGSQDGEDILFGDNGQILLTVGVTGRLNFSNSAVRELRTLDIAEATGGGDLLSGNGKDDTILGGVGADTIYGDAADPGGFDGNDLILGDNGWVNFGTDLGDLDEVKSIPYAVTNWSTNPHTLDTSTMLGGNDTISGGWGSDTILGGVGSDVLYGDSATLSAGIYDGRDVLVGDNARILYAGDKYPGTATPGEFYSSPTRRSWASSRRIRSRRPADRTRSAEMPGSMSSSAGWVPTPSPANLPMSFKRTTATSSLS